MMYGKMKDKMPMKGSKEESVMEKKKPMAGIEIEIEGDDEPEGEEPEMAESEEGMDEEVSVGELAKFSDEELKAELEKRAAGEGKEVASGGSSVLALPEGEEEEEEVAVPKKKKA